MQQKKIIKAERLTKKFFESMGGKLLSSRCTMVKTYSSQNLIIPCVNYYISFNNKYLFGKGNFSDEVYPRYRRMRNDWKNILKKSGIKLYSDIAVGFVPLLGSANLKKNEKFKYKKDQKKPIGTKIVNITKDSLYYYEKMAARFNVEFALKESRGMFVGPEKGMLCALEAACNILKKIDCFVDVGAGTGEMSAYVLKNYNPKKVVINEISQNLKKHLRNYLKKISGNNKTKLIFSFQDCQKIKFPTASDVISVGVFYGVQPSLIQDKGSEMAKSLGKRGLLLIQSAMPETLFNQHILMGDEDRLNKWPWYSKKFILSNYFSCVKTFFIDNQFITLASQSHYLVSKIITKLDKEVISYSDFISGDKKIKIK